MSNECQVSDAYSRSVLSLLPALADVATAQSATATNNTVRMRIDRPPLRLALDSGHGHALREPLLQDQEEADHGQHEHDRARHQQSVVGLELASAEDREGDRQRVLLLALEDDERPEQRVPGREERDDRVRG